MHELESRKELISLGETVSELTKKIKEQESRIKDQTDRIFQLEQLVPPLEALMKFKKELYSKQNKQRDKEFQEYVKSKDPKIEDFPENTERKQKQAKKPRPKDS